MVEVPDKLKSKNFWDTGSDLDIELENIRARQPLSAAEYKMILEEASKLAVWDGVERRTNERRILTTRGE